MLVFGFKLHFNRFNKRYKIHNWFYFDYYKQNQFQNKPYENKKTFKYKPLCFNIKINYLTTNSYKYTVLDTNNISLASYFPKLVI